MTTENTERPFDHRGVLFIRADMLTQLAPEITLDTTNTQGQLRDTGVFARLRERLLLPDSYTLVAVFAQNFGREWAILIESPELPDVGEFSWESIEYPRIEPTYCQTYSEETGKYEPHLVKIKVHAQRTVPIKGGLEWLLKATAEPAEKAHNIRSKEREEGAREIIFDPHAQPWPECVVPWSSVGYQPRDGSWGYVRTPEKRVHIQAGDRIVIDPQGVCRVEKTEKSAL